MTAEKTRKVIVAAKYVELLPEDHLLDPGGERHHIRFVMVTAKGNMTVYELSCSRETYDNVNVGDVLTAKRWGNDSCSGYKILWPGEGQEHHFGGWASISGDKKDAFNTAVVLRKV